MNKPLKIIFLLAAASVIAITILYLMVRVDKLEKDNANLLLISIGLNGKVKDLDSRVEQIENMRGY